MAFNVIYSAGGVIDKVREFPIPNSLKKLYPGLSGLWRLMLLLQMMRF